MSLLKHNILLKRENKQLKQTLKSQKAKFEKLRLRCKQSEEGLAQKEEELQKWNFDYAAFKQETIPLDMHHQTLKSFRE